MPAIGSLFYGFSKRSFQRPMPNSVAQGRVRHSEPQRPILSAQRQAVASDIHIGRHVAILLWGGCPSAVHRPVVFSALRTLTARVMAFIANPIYGVTSRWPTANGSQEVLKRISPSLTHLYASFSISLRSFVVQVEATLNHHLMALVFRRSTKPVIALRRIAPARLSVARSQRINPRGMLASAVTITQSSLFSASSYVAQKLTCNNKPSESLTNNIFSNHIWRIA